MGALLIALIIGSILVFWNFNSLIESCDKNDGLKNFFNLNIMKRRKGCFFIFIFSIFLSFTSLISILLRLAYLDIILL